ncbi:hypothetical protein BGZ47_009216 [Haplosporangium gracile]|nr:hypothetical protein BGZ47_009216 [Haplosporangium gracile]
MSEPAFLLPSAHAHTTKQTIRGGAVLHQPSVKRLHIFKDVDQQQQQQHSGSTTSGVPATTRRRIHNLPNSNSNNGSQIESTTTAPDDPWPFMPHASQPGPITISNRESTQHSLSNETQQPQQQPQQPQQQQQKRRQLPFNSQPTIATATASAQTRKRTNSASSTSTTSVTYLRDAAAAFIATAHHNHFQFPHEVLHPEIQHLSTTHLDLLHDFSSEDDDDSFTSRELWSTLLDDMETKAMGSSDDIHGIEKVFMAEEDDDDQLEDDGGRGFESTTPPLDLGQVVNTDEQFWIQQPHYDPILFPSTTTATSAAVDALASSDTPVHALSSYRPSPHTRESQLSSNNLQAHCSIESKEADQDHFSSVQDHHPSTGHHRHHFLYHRHREARKQHQRQMYLFGQQDNTINNITLQDRSVSPPHSDNYAYQQGVISDNPSSSPLPPPLFFPTTTSFSPTNHHSTCDASEFAESAADRGSQVSELSSGGVRNHVKQQPHHTMSLFSPMVDGNDGSSGGQAPPRQESRSEHDREVFEVCSRRLQPEFAPSQNIHKALVSSIRASFLASLNGSQRASLMNGDSPSVQQSIPGDEDLQDFQQSWYHPQQLPYHASPDQGYISHSRSFEKETSECREEELLEVIARLEKDLQELHHSTVKLQVSLRESEERNERMIVEHDCNLRRAKEDHDHQIQDTKKRTKRFHDESIRKRQRDENKRLEGLQEQLTQAQAANKELRATIRGLQRERLDAEQDQRDDLSVLCLFIENVLSPMVIGLTADGEGVDENNTQLQAAGTFEHRRSTTINIVTATVAKGHSYDHDLTPTTAVPHPIPLSTPSTQDNPSKPPPTTTTTGQCTSPRGQKCMSLLEQFQIALSISFANATATAATIPTTPHNSDKASTISQAAGGLQQEESLKTLAPSRKTHSRYNHTTTTATTITKHGQHDTLTDDHLVRLHETERLEYLNSLLARKRYSDSSNASSGHTLVAPTLPLMPFRQGVISKSAIIPATNTPAATPTTTPRVPAASEKPPTSVSVSIPNSTTTIAVSSPEKHITTTTTSSSSSSSSPLTKTKSNNTDNIEKQKEEDRSLQQCLAEQHTRHQKEIERIKQQCIKLYRQSLEDVRADMKFKLGQRGVGGWDHRQRASATTVAVVPVVATATAH